MLHDAGHHPHLQRNSLHVLRTKEAWIYQRGARSTKAVLLRQVVNLTCVTATRTVKFRETRMIYYTWVRCSLRRVCICNVDERGSLLRVGDDLLRIMARGALFLEHLTSRLVIEWCMVVDIVNYLTRWTINNSR